MINRNQNTLFGNLFGGLFGNRNAGSDGGKPQPRRGIYEPTEVASYIRDASALAHALADNPDALMDEARDLGFNHLQSAEIAAGETSHGFQNRLEDHRLIVNSCDYSDAVRLMVHVHIPGKLPLEDVARLRRETGFSGSEGVWEGTAYAHWKKKGAAQPQFLDIWIDNYETTARIMPLTRMMIEIVRQK